MRMPWSKADAEERTPHWELVPPGTRGEPQDDFDSFSFWIPSPRLERFVRDEGEAAGENDLPDVTGQHPLPDPPGIDALEEIVDDALAACSRAASDLFAPIGRQIDELVGQLSNVPDGRENNPQRAKRKFQRALVELEVAIGDMERLEDALLLRLSRILAHGNSLAQTMISELLDEHIAPGLVTTYWRFQDYDIEAHLLIFGQDHSRQKVDELRPILADAGFPFAGSMRLAPSQLARPNIVENAKE